MYKNKRGENKVEFIFLGTSAGEQYPGFWCQCENCEKARQLGGRNIRKNSCAWISPNCLIDFPPEIFMQAEHFGIKMINTEYLLITHSHEDHFYPYMLGWRRMPLGTNLPPERNLVGPRFSKLKTLKIYGNNTVCMKIRKWVKGNLAEYAAQINLVEPFRQYDLKEMQIIPLLANHPDGNERGLNYIIKKNGRTILYALDTGWFLPETEAEIKKHKFNLVVIEGTFGYGAEDKVHMNFRKVEKAYRLFRTQNLLKDKGLFCVSHLCPHFTPVHDEIAPIMAKKGITIAYDGMKIEI